MNRIPLFSMLMCFALVVGCGNDTGQSDIFDDAGDVASEDVVFDVSRDVSAVDAISDTDVEVIGDVPGDSSDDGTGGETTVSDAKEDSTELPPPDPDFVYEVKTRQNCVADGPWKVDRVQRFLDTTASCLDSMDARSVAVDGDSVWVMTDEGMYKGLTADLIETGCFSLAGSASGTGMIREYDHDGGGIIYSRDGQVEIFSCELPVFMGPPLSSPVTDLVSCNSAVYAISDSVLYHMVAGEAAQEIDFPGQSPHALACSGGSLLVAADGGVYEYVDSTTMTLRWDSGSVPVTSLAVGTGLVAASTGDNLILLDSAAWTAVTIEPGKGGLPTGDISGLDVSDDDRYVALAHAVGVSVIDLNPGGTEGLAVGRITYGQDSMATVDHFNSLRWLPSDTVADIAFDSATGDLWVATAVGLSRLYTENIQLADKAETMFGNLNNWFWRLDGFVSAWANFEDIDLTTRLPLRDDDNDGQWTQEAVGAFCYAYKVTGDERYYEAAKKAMTNMCLQIDIPAQDFIEAGLGRGFVTRSFVRDDEGAVFSSKATQDNWHPVDYMDGHQYYWKDDTSSDEITGHFFGFSIYHDLCAKDDTERAWVAEHLTALVGYILGHNLYLLDLDTEPTEHGKYAPEYLAVALDGLEACTLSYDFDRCISANFGGGFLDSLEIMGGLLAAWHVSGEQRFYDAYEILIDEHRYDELMTFNNDVQTWVNPSIANYCDHELADLAYLTLIRYESNPDRRQRWIDSMMAAWEYEIGERNPLKTLAMAAVQDIVPGTVNGVSTLVDFPEDTRDYAYDNSHRLDAGNMGRDRSQDFQFDTVFPYDEIKTMRWDQNPYRIVDDGSATRLRSPNFWKLPYWGLRYYGVICDSSSAAD